MVTRKTSDLAFMMNAEDLCNVVRGRGRVELKGEEIVGIIGARVYF